MSEYKSNTKYRMSGILASINSLPSPYGIGDLGQGAYDFIDFLSDSGQTLWQILPFGPTGYGDSPYQSYSSFAGQTLIISPDMLKEEGLLAADDLKAIPKWYEDKVDYGYVQYYKTSLYKKAYENFTAIDQNTDIIREYGYFQNEHGWWLNDFALYCAVKDHFECKSWLEWDEDIRSFKEEARREYSEKLKESVDYYKFLQFMFYRQWFKLKDYANKHGIFIVGDTPIFVALDGSDTWAHQDLFKLESDGKPTFIAGVPPDYFSSTGQLWGNPIYNWDKLRENNFRWWVERIKHTLHLTDYLRIDHFVGLDRCWAVPNGEKTAENGHWEYAPCRDFIKAVFDSFGGEAPIFAEDLGTMTDEASAVKYDFKIPGMKILQFAFGGGSDNWYLPHNHFQDSICYTGTHDNDTTVGWFHNASKETIEHAKAYTGLPLTDVAWDFIRIALSSTCRYAIIPVTDLLSIGSEGRLNTPGAPSGNWAWRFRKDALTPEIGRRLNELTTLYGR